MEAPLSRPSCKQQGSTQAFRALIPLHALVFDVFATML